MHYVNTAFKFWGNCFLNYHIFVSGNKSRKVNKLVLVFFLTDKKFKKIGCSFEVTYCFNFKF